MARHSLRVVRLPLARAIVGGLVVAVPFVGWAVRMVGDGFPDSGRVGGTVGLALIACVLVGVFWPAAWATLRDDLVPVKRIGLFAVAVACAHVVAFVGITVSQSNIYFLAYPLASAVAAYVILRDSSSESVG